MNAKAYRNILCAQCEPNALKLTGQHSIISQNNPKHTAEATRKEDYCWLAKWMCLGEHPSIDENIKVATDFKYLSTKC